MVMARALYPNPPAARAALKAAPLSRRPLHSAKDLREIANQFRHAADKQLILLYKVPASLRCGEIPPKVSRAARFNGRAAQHNPDNKFSGADRACSIDGGRRHKLLNARHFSTPRPA